jgi:hypothetical protein
MQDNSTGILLKIDLSNVLQSYNSDTALSEILPYTTGCNVKHFFNINSIDIISKKTLSNADSSSYYMNNMVPYFKPQTTVFKSSLALNRLLYDQFFTQHRQSLLLFDLSGDNEAISVYFYKVILGNTDMTVALFEYNTT